MRGNKEEYIKKVEKIIKDSWLYTYTSGESDDEIANKIVREVVQALYQLHIEGVREVIGEDEITTRMKSGVAGIIEHNQKAWDRNELRAEQREKLKK